MEKIFINDRRIKLFASFLRGLPEVRPFNFCSLEEGSLLPSRGRPGVVDYFFFCCAHQFGFWYLENDRYARPMIARIEGRELKGSDYLWRCATRAWSIRPDFFSPRSLAALTERDWAEVFQDDEGRNPLPMWPEHFKIIHEYSRWLLEQDQTPVSIVAYANRQPRVLKAFIQKAGVIPGYTEDPLRKKLFLLATVLENRPEGFLEVNDPESLGPIIDYHLQRSALRTGLVEVSDPSLRAKLKRRELVSGGEEKEVRAAVFQAVQRLIRASAISASAVDYFFFTNRKRCPEMAVPECSACPVNPVCARRTELFQPVFRTTAY